MIVTVTLRVNKIEMDQYREKQPYTVALSGGGMYVSMNLDAEFAAVFKIGALYKGKFEIEEDKV